MNNNEIVFGENNKSFLRKKWDLLFKKIVIKRIPNIYIKNNQVLNINSETQLKNLIDPKNFDSNKKWKVIILSFPLNNFVNLVSFFDSLDKALDEETKIVVNYYSWIWRPIFSLFSIIGLINNYNLLFFSKNTLNTFLRTCNFEVSKNLNNFFLPIDIPFVGKFITIILNLIPFSNYLNVSNIFFLRKKVYKNKQNQKLSLIVPCKNEELNIKSIVNDCREKLNFPYELIFIDDRSSDQTLNIMNECKVNNVDLDIKITKGLGQGRGLAVSEGVKIAKGLTS